MQSLFFLLAYGFLNYTLLTSKTDVLGYPTKYLIILSHTCIWACHGKRKESKATVFHVNLNTGGMLEMWRREGVPSPFAPHPLAVTVCERDGQQPYSSAGRGWEGWLVHLEAGWSFPGLARAAFTHVLLSASMRASCRRWLGCTWKGFQGCIALQAFACHVGVKPWTLFSNSITLINSRQAGFIWLGMFL